MVLAFREHCSQMRVSPRQKGWNYNHSCQALETLPIPALGGLITVPSGKGCFIGGTPSDGVLSRFPRAVCRRIQTVRLPQKWQPNPSGSNPTHQHPGWRRVRGVRGGLGGWEGQVWGGWGRSQSKKCCDPCGRKFVHRWLASRAIHPTPGDLPKVLLRVLTENIRTISSPLCLGSPFISGQSIHSPRKPPCSSLLQTPHCPWPQRFPQTPRNRSVGSPW